MDCLSNKYLLFTSVRLVNTAAIFPFIPRVHSDTVVPRFLRHLFLCERTACVLYKNYGFNVNNFCFSYYKCMAIFYIILYKVYLYEIQFILVNYFSVILLFQCFYQIIFIILFFIKLLDSLPSLINYYLLHYITFSK